MPTLVDTVDNTMVLVIPVDALSKTVLRIRIYYYADPDPGFKKCPYGSGS